MAITLLHPGKGRLKTNAWQRSQCECLPYLSSVKKKEKNHYISNIFNVVLNETVFNLVRKHEVGLLALTWRWLHPHRKNCASGPIALSWKRWFNGMSPEIMLTFHFRFRRRIFQTFKRWRIAFSFDFWCKVTCWLTNCLGKSYKIPHWIKHFSHVYALFYGPDYVCKCQIVRKDTGTLPCDFT